MTYSGPTVVLQGTLVIGSTSQNGTVIPTQTASINNTSSIYVNAGAVLNFNTMGTVTINAPITLNGNGSLQLGSTNNANVIINGTITGTDGNGSLGLQLNGSGSGNITLSQYASTLGSPGNLTINSANPNFTGSTSVNSGNLIIGNNLALSNSLVTINQNIGGNSGNIQFAANVTAPFLGGLGTNTQQATSPAINLATLTGQRSPVRW